MTVTYEWCISIINANTNETAVDFDADAAGALAIYRQAADRGEEVYLELVRNVGNDVEGITDRSWALFDADAGTLPQFTDYGGDERAHRVPQRFHQQLARALGANRRT